MLIVLSIPIGKIDTTWTKVCLYRIFDERMTHEFQWRERNEQQRALLNIALLPNTWVWLMSLFRVLFHNRLSAFKFTLWGSLPHRKFAIITRVRFTRHVSSFFHMINVIMHQFHNTILVPVSYRESSAPWFKISFYPFHDFFRWFFTACGLLPCPFTLAALCLCSTEHTHNKK